MKNSMSVKFLALNENVIFSRSIAASFLLSKNIELSIINEIKTAISEAVTNAIVHGYRNNNSKTVEMKMEYDDEKITIEVIDNGVGITDIEKAKEPLFSTREDEERAGLGFTIMEVFMDQVFIISSPNEGTTIKLIKKYVDDK